MKIKTSELTGAALDWAVGKAGDYHRDYPYSTDWVFGGPIIERERISVWTPMTCHKQSEWVAGKPAVWEGEEVEIDREFYGPTPLVAAMRCYVDSKLGAEVDIPKELIP